MVRPSLSSTSWAGPKLPVRAGPARSRSRSGCRRHRWSAPRRCRIDRDRLKSFRPTSEPTSYWPLVGRASSKTSMRSVDVGIGLRWAYSERSGGGRVAAGDRGARRPRTSRRRPRSPRPRPRPCTCRSADRPRPASATSLEVACHHDRRRRARADGVDRGPVAVLGVVRVGRGHRGDGAEVGRRRTLPPFAFRTSDGTARPSAGRQSAAE